MAVGSSSDVESGRSSSPPATSAPSSPPTANSPTSSRIGSLDYDEQKLLAEEEKAREENAKAEERREAGEKRRRRKKVETKAERLAKARDLDRLLQQSATFSDILTKKTEVLGRVGSGFDGKTLGEHNLKMAEQPKCVVGGTMRDYQLEGLTWMYEVCEQGLSGILADEMGLGKWFRRTPWLG
jgi:ATP-dependent DNA helicase